MAVTFGFYNAINEDRAYDAIQMSSIFDGIIQDGVYETIGNAFKVSASSNNQVSVDTGRAWFDHTWTLNDAILLLDLDEPELLLDRIDAVVLEVDSSPEVRANKIKVVKGTPSLNAVKPQLVNTEELHQHPFAYVSRKAGSSTIEQADITNAIGTSECPFVIGVIKTMEIDFIVDQWASQWNVWLRDTTTKAEHNFIQWMMEQEFDFDKWFKDIQDTLDGNVAANLASKIATLQQMFDTLAKDRVIYSGLQDNDLNGIEDSAGNVIQGRSLLAGSEASPTPTIETILGFSPDPAIFHKTVFRGKNLGDKVTDDQLRMIREGTFYDLWVGDYWEIGGNVWRIMDINYWMYIGNELSSTEFRNHLVIMPDMYTGLQQMHNSATCAGGFMSSTMEKSTLPYILNTVLTPLFGESVVGHLAKDTSGWANHLPNASTDHISKVTLPTVEMLSSGYPRRNVYDYYSDSEELAICKMDRRFALFPNLLEPNKDKTAYSYWTRTWGSETTAISQLSNDVTSAQPLTNKNNIRPVFAIA